MTTEVCAEKYLTALLSQFKTDCVLSKCLTNALVIGMQQFHQWSRRPLTVDEFS